MNAPVIGMPGEHGEKPDWQVRVIEEKAQLDQRLERLISFIGGAQYAKLADADRELMLAQRRIMGELSGVLEARIARFT